jgi:hypothetical protein
MVTTTEFFGHLTAESPLRKIFPAGRVPLITPLESPAELEKIPGTQRCFMLAVQCCTPEQREAMCADMVARGQGNIEEARAYMQANDALPCRAFHFSATSCPLRFLI